MSNEIHASSSGGYMKMLRTLTLNLIFIALNLVLFSIFVFNDATLHESDWKFERDVRNLNEQTHKITRNFTSHMVIWGSVDKVSSFRKTFNFQANMMKMTKSVFNIKTTEMWVNKQAEWKIGPLPCEHVVCCLETSANAIDYLIDFTFYFSTFHNSTSLSRVALKRINSKEAKQI